MQSDQLYDVIIIGGSYAGLSAAMALGRSLRDVLIIDSGQPCNAQTPHSHNFLTQDGARPADIKTIALDQVLAYTTVKYHQAWATHAEKVEEGFQVFTEAEEGFRARKLIFATGIRDQFPEIPGFKESWGKTIVHCPYCHGYEFRGKKTALLANGPKAFHLAGLIHNLSQDLAIITGGKADFSPEQLNILSKKNIRLIEKSVSCISNEKGILKKLVLEDQTSEEFEVAYAAVPFYQHSAIPESLGCLLDEHGYIQTNQMRETTVPGIYACGDNSSMMRSVANAVYTGNFAGAIVNMALVEGSR